MFSPFSQAAPSTYRLLSFARVMTKKGHNITVILPSYDRYSGFKVGYDNKDSEVKIITPFQIKSRNLIANSLPYSLAATLKALKVNADVLHILKPTPIGLSGYLTKFFRKIPAIQDIDDLDHLIMMAEGHSRISTMVMQQCEQTIPRFATKIVVSNTGLQRLYSSKNFADKVSMIPNGVFIDDFSVKADLHLKAHYALKQKVITYVGSLNNAAQLRPLILAMKNVVNEEKDVSCLIIGDGTAKQSLQQLVHDLGIADSVVFTGKVPHAMVPKFLSISDIGYACFPALDYLNYVSNIKVFEYMAAGVPAIVSSTGDLPFYVDYGHAGLISDAEPNILSTKISNLLSDDRQLKELSRNSKNYVKNFDWNILGKKLLDVYEHLVN